MAQVTFSPPFTTPSEVASQLRQGGYAVLSPAAVAEWIGCDLPALMALNSDWAALPPRQVRLDELVTTKDTLQLDLLLDEDSTFFGDLFAHVVLWHDELYLEDGLHRALRAALQQRHVVHARVYEVEG